MVTVLFLGIYFFSVSLKRLIWLHNYSYLGRYLVRTLLNFLRKIGKTLSCFIHVLVCHCLVFLQEHTDEVFDLLERKKKQTLAHKRSFFVRMVSDPKIYNPSIAKSIPSVRRHISETVDLKEEHITLQPPS